MSTTSIDPATGPAPALRAPDGRYGVLDVVRSEWTKLRSVQSTFWCLGIVVVAVLGLGALFSFATASHWASLAASDKLSYDPTQISLSGFFLAQLVVGVLGVLVVSAEYGTGTILASLSAIPHRPLMLGCKAALYTLLVAIVGEVLAFVAFLGGQQIISSAGKSSVGVGGPFGLLPSLPPHATLSQPGVARAVVGAGLYLAVIGLFAFGIGAIIRNTAGSIATFVGVLFVPALFSQLIPRRWRGDVVRFLPDRIGNTLTTTVPPRGSDVVHVFSPWVGFAVLCAYAVGLWLLAALLIVRRDA